METAQNTEEDKDGCPKVGMTSQHVPHLHLRFCMWQTFFIQSDLRRRQYSAV